jgi:hypothetical protein
MATLDEAVKQISGLTKHELYTGLRSGKYQGYRVGGKRGKWIVDLDLLENRIKELMERNIKEENNISQFGQLRRVKG